MPISSLPQNSPMMVPKQSPGVVEPPQEQNVPSSQEMQERAQALQQYLASQSLQNGGGGGGTSFFGFLFKGIVLIGLGVAAYKKRESIMNFAKAAYAKVRGFDIKIKDRDELANYAQELKNIKPADLTVSDLKAMQMRLNESSADDIKSAIGLSRQAADSVKYSKSVTPVISIFLKEGASTYKKAISEAVRKGNLNSLPEEALRSIDMINLNYKSNKGQGIIEICTLENKIIETSKSAKSMLQGLKDFFD